MKTDNELISEFMGWRLEQIKHQDIYDELWVFNRYDYNGNIVGFYSGGNDDFFTKESANIPYDTSWDWLMPVVEKIDKETNFEFTLLITTPIEEVYKAVVEFIKWYNSQKA